MPVVDELVTRMRLDASGVRAGAWQARGAMGGLENTMNSLTGSLSGFGKGLKGLGPILSTVSMGLQEVVQFAKEAALAIGAVATAVVMAGKKAGDFEAMVEALVAVNKGDRKRTDQNLTTLRDIARQPGLGLEESVQGYTRLRRSGADEQLAFDLVRELGNQNALGGHGKAELESLFLVAGQILNKGKFQGEEAMQFAENDLPILDMLEKAFGTRDTEVLIKRGVTGKEVLKGLVEVMKEHERVVGKSKNVYENATDAIEQGIVAFGTGANEGGLNAAITRVSNTIESLVESGALEQFGTMVGGVFDSAIPKVEDFEEATIHAMAQIYQLTWTFQNVLIPAFAAVAEAAVTPFKKLFDLAKMLRENTNPAIKAFVDSHLPGIDKLIDGLGGIDAINPQPNPFDFGDRAKEFIDEWEMDKALRDKRRKEAEEAGTEPGDEPTLGQDENTRANVRTANATERMAAQIDRMIIGGGDRGAMGFTRVDRSDASGLVRRRRSQVLAQMLTLGWQENAFQPGR